MKQQLRIENIDPNLLTANSWNTNVVSPDNERKLAESIKRFGFFKPILARRVNGNLEVLGGEHRWQAAQAAGMTTVPVIDLGELDDKTAKEISLVDNGRYGSDDTLQLASLLESLGDPAEIAGFMPYDNKELEAIFSSVNIALDDLELDDSEQNAPPAPPSRKVQEFQVMRFKIPVDDAAMVSDKIAKIMKEQKFTEDDSLTNAGLALVHLCK